MTWNGDNGRQSVNETVNGNNQYRINRLISTSVRPLAQSATEVSVQLLQLLRIHCTVQKAEKLCTGDWMEFLFGGENFNTDKRLSLCPSLLNTSYWSRLLGKEIWFRKTLSRPSFAILFLPRPLAVIHKWVQPGEYRHAHFNLESMNKQWGFHVLQKFPLVAFTDTLYGQYTFTHTWNSRCLCGTECWRDVSHAVSHTDI